MIKEEFELITAPEVKRITVPGYSLCYREWGSGAPLICLPGWPVTSVMFAPLASLASKSVRIIALDYPGWGVCPLGQKKLETLDDYASVVELFVRELNLSSFSLLGYSYGGVVAQKVIAHSKIHPDKLALISTLYSNRFLKDPLFGTGVRLSNVLIKGRLFESRIRTMVKNSYKLIYMTRSYREIMNTPVVDLLVDETMQGDMETLLYAGKALVDNTLISKKDIGGPALVEYASNDIPFVIEDSKEISQSLGVEPLVLDGLDHSHIFVFPERTADSLLSFLNS